MSRISPGAVRRALWRAAAPCTCVLATTSCDDFVNYDCSAFPPAESSPYILPWTVGHAYTAYPHAARDTGRQQYAVDVLMPVGTPILAMSNGLAVFVEESFLDPDHVKGHENFVLIKNPDANVTLYVHLTFLGAVVQVGDTVQQGDLIGSSGDSGNSTQPHTHVEVLQSCSVGPPLEFSVINQCVTIPLSFRNASPASTCGLRYGVTYAAQP